MFNATNANTLFFSFLSYANDLILPIVKFIDIEHYASSMFNFLSYNICLIHLVSLMSLGVTKY